MNDQLTELLAKANVLRAQGESTRSRIKEASDGWREKLNKASQSAPTLAKKGAIFAERELLP